MAVRKFTEKDFYRALNELYYCGHWPWWKRALFEMLWVLGIKT